MEAPQSRRAAIDTDTIKKAPLKLRFPFKDQSDSLSGTVIKSPLYLKDPSNITEEVDYDPITKQYTIRRKVGSFEFRRPIVLDFNEYQKYDMEKALRSYWY